MMPSYTRTNAVPGQSITLQTKFYRFGNPIDPFSVGPVRIAKKDPRDPTYNASTDLLETIPAEAISKIGIGTYQYSTAAETIDSVGLFYDAFTFKFEEGGDDFVVVNTFSVTADGLPKLGYISVQDLRDEGLTSTTKYPDARLNERIDYWSRQVEQWTGLVFEARKMVIEVDGQGTFEQSFDMPIVSIESINIIEGEFPRASLRMFDLSDVVIYNRHLSQGLTSPDDREDPRIGNAYFPRGRMNVRISGTFGYTDVRGQTPVQIKRVLKLLVMRDKELLNSPYRKNSLLSGLAGTLISETTDGHSYRLAAPTRAAAATGYYTGDPEIDMILSEFSRPMRIGKNLGSATAGLIDNLRPNYGSSSYYGRNV